jgi:hypothetical protein
VVLFFDCCRSPLPITVPRPTLGFEEISGLGKNVRCGVGLAAEPGFVAYETPIDKPTRGAFSKLLICALRNLRVDETLTAEQLENYIQIGIGKLVAPNNQLPSVEVVPRREKYNLKLAIGPAIGPPPDLVIDLSQLPAGMQVIVRDPDLEVFQTLLADDQLRAFRRGSADTPSRRRTKGFWRSSITSDRSRPYVSRNCRSRNPGNFDRGRSPRRRYRDHRFAFPPSRARRHKGGGAPPGRHLYGAVFGGRTRGG